MSQAAGVVANDFEMRTRKHEAAWLSDLAVSSYDSKGRLHPDGDDGCSVRTPFQVDRDRILHSKAYRRLLGKTQVFIAPEGDHYRVRLTHTLEVTAISRTVARALGLNEDLTEAIGLGHDLGHPPFGHTGEYALDAALAERFGRRFHHNQQSLRVVDVLEKDGRGLNLTYEVRDGILCHTGQVEPQTLEGAIVRLVDRIAYINHDIDDALRAGLLDRKDLPAGALELLGPTGSRRIDKLVHDLVETSQEERAIRQSAEVGAAMMDLRSFMFANVYLGTANKDKERIGELLPRLVDYYFDHPDELPAAQGDKTRGDDLAQRVTDYVAGMTDRYCLRRFRELFLPGEWRF